MLIRMYEQLAELMLEGGLKSHFLFWFLCKFPWLGHPVSEYAFYATMPHIVSLLDQSSFIFWSFFKVSSVKYLLFQNVRPSAENLPEDLALIVTSCWKEDPSARPNFSQIIQMLLHYLSVISPPEPVLPPRMYSSENTVFPPESPGTSSLMAARHGSGETPMDSMEEKPISIFSCFRQCYWSQIIGRQSSINYSLKHYKNTSSYLKRNVNLLKVSQFSWHRRPCWSWCYSQNFPTPLHIDFSLSKSWSWGCWDVVSL